MNYIVQSEYGNLIWTF